MKTYTKLYPVWMRSVAIALLMLGLDPRKLSQIKKLPRYLRELRSFKSVGGAVTHYLPILADYGDTAGEASGHYFHQDLLVASLVHDTNPERHIDVGSRIDGFVAHVASFRRIEVMDIRELNDTGHANISFLMRDLMRPSSDLVAVADSVSCLHAIEHFGLGRYSDPLSPDGHKEGFRNIWRMVKPGGHLYIAFPIGESNEIHFNSHRVFHPRDIFTWISEVTKSNLQRFDFVDDFGSINKNVDLFARDLSVKHGCGIYTLRKLQ